MRLLKFILFIFIGAMLSSCRKDLITTNPADKLSFSTDTLTFDTVFTTLGSTTLYFTVHNPNNKKIVVSDIRLADGNAAMWRLNIDGMQVNEATNVEIPANDSIYVFVSVTVDPNNDNNPYVLYDSVMFQTNGNEQKVTLQAWGQNAHFFYGQVINTQEWFNDKPYVIIHSILVDSLQTLTIDPGCKIYMHADSRFYVYGTLKVMGQLHDTVQFRGDRLEQYFVDLPGNWEGIHLLRSSHDNEINYAVIKEAQVGIRIDSLKETAAPKLTLRNSVIKYTLSSGILGITSDIYGENCLVFNCGDWDVQLEYGGNDTFQNCTFADFSNILINHQSPVVRMSNYFYYKDEFGDHYLPADLNASFTNCIVYGSLDNELDRAQRNESAFNYRFDHCLMKLADTTNTATSSFLSILKNQDPLFVDAYNKDDYHLSAGSPCIDAGVPNGITADLVGKTRMGNPDIGCYEF
ncbi:MAG TPA: choice-of-anchor Q domain-containing protein [Chitinophagales bacterium]|nr:choice-of-anchor Q domain-containing protein [Chitinophagales bacterium]